LTPYGDAIQRDYDRYRTDEQGAAEGSNDTIYPNAEVIKSKNGKPVGEIYQDGNSWGAFHYKADRGYDFIDSREEAIEALKDLHQETGRSRPDYTIKGVAEGYDDEEHPIRDDGNEGRPGKQRYPGKLKTKGVAEAIPYALSAANANAEYERTKTFVPRGYKGRVDTEVSGQQEYRSVMAALKKLAQEEGQHIETGLSGTKMSIFSKTMGEQALSDFVDMALDNFDQGVAEGEKSTHTSALGKALYRDLSKEKKASPQQVQRNKERWAKRQAEREQGVAEGRTK
jgi:hypothetical protein